MKKYILILLTLLFVGFSYAQNKEEETDIPYSKVEQKPRFQECKDVPEDETFKCFQEVLNKHIENTLKYPTEAKEVGIEGRVNVSFRIKKDGSTEVIGLRGVDKVLEQEAKRIIESMPKLIPAKQNGKPIAVTIAYPIFFKL